jgi:hypothetical protein
VWRATTLDLLFLVLAAAAMVFDAFGHELHCTPKETAALQVATLQALPWNTDVMYTLESSFTTLHDDW